jgi:hypothetical protein
VISTRPSKDHDFAVLRDAGVAIRPDIVLAVGAAFEPQLGRLAFVGQMHHDAPVGPLAMT